MKVQVVTFYPSHAESTEILIGVFSDAIVAVDKGLKAVRNMYTCEPTLLDWDHEHPIHRYFYTEGTLTVTEAILDEVSSH